MGATEFSITPSEALGALLAEGPLRPLVKQHFPKEDEAQDGMRNLINQVGEMITRYDLVVAHRQVADDPKSPQGFRDHRGLGKFELLVALWLRSVGDRAKLERYLDYLSGIKGPKLPESTSHAAFENLSLTDDFTFRMLIATSFINTSKLGKEKKLRFQKFMRDLWKHAHYQDGEPDYSKIVPEEDLFNSALFTALTSTGFNREANKKGRVYNARDQIRPAIGFLIATLQDLGLENIERLKDKETGKLKVEWLRLILGGLFYAWSVSGVFNNPPALILYAWECRNLWEDYSHHTPTEFFLLLFLKLGIHKDSIDVETAMTAAEIGLKEPLDKEKEKRILQQRSLPHEAFPIEMNPKGLHRRYFRTKLIEDVQIEDFIDGIDRYAESREGPFSFFHHPPRLQGQTYEQIRDNLDFLTKEISTVYFATDNKYEFYIKASSYIEQWLESFHSHFLQIKANNSSNDLIETVTELLDLTYWIPQQPSSSIAYRFSLSQVINDLQDLSGEDLSYLKHTFWVRAVKHPEVMSHWQSPQLLEFMISRCLEAVTIENPIGQYPTKEEYQFLKETLTKDEYKYKFLQSFLKQVITVYSDSPVDITFLDPTIHQFAKLLEALDSQHTPQKLYSSDYNIFSPTSAPATRAEVDVRITLAHLLSGDYQSHFESLFGLNTAQRSFHHRFVPISLRTAAFRARRSSQGVSVEWLGGVRKALGPSPKEDYVFQPVSGSPPLGRYGSMESYNCKNLMDFLRVEHGKRKTLRKEGNQWMLKSLADFPLLSGYELKGERDLSGGLKECYFIGGNSQWFNLTNIMNDERRVLEMKIVKPKKLTPKTSP